MRAKATVEKAYALSRLKEIYNKKREGLEEHTELSFAEQIALLRKGKVKVKAELSSWHTDIADVFDWSVFTPKDPHKKERERLEAEHLRIKDDIMLGGGLTAVLSTLRKFMSY